MFRCKRCFSILAFSCAVTALPLSNAGAETPKPENSSNQIIVDAKPSAVTVFLDRAQVTRTMTRTLQKGKYTLVFDDLPYRIDQNSVQLNGDGPVTLVDVKFKKRQYTITPDEKLRALDQEKQKLLDTLTDIDDRIKQAKSEKGFIEKISVRLTTTAEKAPPPQLDPAKWVKMVEFYRTKLSALDKEIRQAERDKRQHKNRLDAVQRKINQLGHNRHKTKNQVHAVILVNKPGKINLKLSYMVRGPSWRPVYDLRVSTGKKKMNITYHAVIRQSTGENWDKVKVSLSTALANVGGQPPKLRPWHISLYDKSRRALDDRRPLPMASKQYYQFSEKSSVARRKEKPAAKSDRLKTSHVSLKSRATSVVFQVEQKYSLASDNTPHKVTIMSRDFDASFRYSSVPKLAPYAYLKARVDNDSAFPFLAGKTNVFLDNNFVANASMKSVAPGEKFWTYLGVDEGVKVDYKFIRKYKENSGVFSKTTKYTYEYLITVTNNKKTAIKLTLWDQIPTSSDEKLQVTLIEPPSEQKDKLFKINKNNFIEWLLKLQAGEKRKIPFKFSVERPADKKVGVMDPVFKMIQEK